MSNFLGGQGLVLKENTRKTSNLNKTGGHRQAHGLVDSNVTYSLSSPGDKAVY